LTSPPGDDVVAEVNMVIPDGPPDPTYCRVVLGDPEGSDSADLTRLLEDCGLRVFRIEELSRSEFDLETTKKTILENLEIGRVIVGLDKNRLPLGILRQKSSLWPMIPMTRKQLGRCRSLVVGC
jgi:hypothetical protein